jgi:hypothetical protein
MVDIVTLGQVFSPANSQSTDCFTIIIIIIIIHLDWDNRPNSGRSTKWTQPQPMRKMRNENTITAEDEELGKACEKMQIKVKLPSFQLSAT